MRHSSSGKSEVSPTVIPFTAWLSHSHAVSTSAAHPMSRPNAPARPIRVHGMSISGHSHRVRLFCALLGLPVEWVEIDVFKGAHRRPEFLALNPFGQVPVIEDDGTVLADSNAILVYLARRYGAPRWLPDEALAAARVQRWLSLAAGELADGPASARVACLVGREPTPAQLGTSHKLFAFMDATLADQAFLAGAEPTLADIAMYSYTAHAPEGAVTLEPYAQLRAWLARMEALPGFVGMARGAVPAPKEIPA
jgi:glutathione S-transferase